ncbi:MAG: hypothetical protein ACOY4H_05445 [Thermodesulfobacteriota bacterium]
MSIKLIALDLYRAQQQVEDLTARCAKATPAEREALEQELRQAEEELRQLRRILDGAKKPLPFRRSLRERH